MALNSVLILIVLAAAVFTDIRTGKIKNWLTIPAMGAGLIVSAILDGTHGLLLSAECLGAAILLGAVVHSFGIMGGGDIKLVAAVAALGAVPDGFSFLGRAVLYTALAGGLQSAAVLIWQRKLAAVGGHLARAAFLKAACGVSSPIGITGRRIPYSLSISAGTVIALFWRF